MRRRGTWTRRTTLPAHVIASQQRRGQLLAVRSTRHSRDRIPAAGKKEAGGARGDGDERSRRG
jgi:hypothetical protein